MARIFAGQEIHFNSHAMQTRFSTRAARTAASFDYLLHAHRHALICLANAPRRHEHAALVGIRGDCRLPKGSPRSEDVKAKRCARHDRLVTLFNVRSAHLAIAFRFAHSNAYSSHVHSSTSPGPGNTRSHSPMIINKQTPIRHHYLPRAQTHSSHTHIYCLFMWPAGHFRPRHARQARCLAVDITPRLKICIFSSSSLCETSLSFCLLRHPSRRTPSSLLRFHSLINSQHLP